MTTKATMVRTISVDMILYAIVCNCRICSIVQWKWIFRFCILYSSLSRFSLSVWCVNVFVIRKLFKATIVFLVACSVMELDECLFHIITSAGYLLTRKHSRLQTMRGSLKRLEDFFPENSQIRRLIRVLPGHTITRDLKVLCMIEYHSVYLFIQVKRNCYVNRNVEFFLNSGI